MAFEVMTTAVKNYLTALEARVKQASGPAYYGMFVDNDQGKFGLSVEPMVNMATLVTNNDDLGYAKTTLQSNEYIFNNWQKISRGDFREEDKPEAGLSDNSRPTDLEGFSYDSETDTITNDIDTYSMVGFVSPDAYEEYIFDVILTSETSLQNDPIGLLVGYARDENGDTHTLTVFRNLRWAWGTVKTEALVVTVDHNTVNETPIAWTSEGLLWSDGTPATGPYPLWSGDDETALKWSSYFPKGVRLRIERNGDDFVVKTSNLGEDDFVPEAELSFNLNDNPELKRFKGPSPYGYVALSQDNAIWSALQRPGNAPTVIDARTGEKHEWNGTDWEITNVDMDTVVKRGRLYYNNFNGKAFYCDQQGQVKQILQST